MSGMIIEIRVRPGAIDGSVRCQHPLTSAESALFATLKAAISVYARAAGVQQLVQIQEWDKPAEPVSGKTWLLILTPNDPKRYPVVVGPFTKRDDALDAAVMAYNIHARSGEHGGDRLPSDLASQSAAFDRIKPDWREAGWFGQGNGGPGQYRHVQVIPGLSAQKA